LTQALRPIFAATVLAFSHATAPCSQAASYMNWNDLKSSSTFTPMAGESLERINVKTMPFNNQKPD
jgi:hypothetical protein